MAKKIIVSTTKEISYLAGILRVLKSDIKTSKSMGIKVTKEEEDVVSGLSKKFQAAL